MASAGEPEATTAYDVAIVGGGPGGCAAAVFTARYGLDTVVFDKGPSALRRCAYLENYLGFPGGIDPPTFIELMHTHVETAGGSIVQAHVETVSRDQADDDEFLLETADGTRMSAAHVVAAAWYDGSYLRGLDDEAMFTEHEHHGEVEERFDPRYADGDGRTPIDGLYVVSPAEGRSAQVLSVAGHGAHVARTLLEDTRIEAGYVGGVAPQYDWRRKESELTGEWSERDRWREWFHNEYEGAATGDALAGLREPYIDRAFETALDPAAVERRTTRGYEALLEVIPDEQIRAYLADTDSAE